MSRQTDPSPTTERCISSSVDVPVDPEAAFTAFTEELDLWWVRGPINHHAAGRMRAMRCEPGVGGRLLEVYDDETGHALELARITEWEPGKRLAWHSSIDDQRHRPPGPRRLLRPAGHGGSLAGEGLRLPVARSPPGG